MAPSKNETRAFPDGLLADTSQVARPVPLDVYEIIVGFNASLYFRRQHICRALRLLPESRSSLCYGWELICLIISLATYTCGHA